MSDIIGDDRPPSRRGPVLAVVLAPVLGGYAVVGTCRAPETAPAHAAPTATATPTQPATRHSAIPSPYTSAYPASAAPTPPPRDGRPGRAPRRRRPDVDSPRPACAAGGRTSGSRRRGRHMTERRAAGDARPVTGQTGSCCATGRQPLGRSTTDTRRSRHPRVSPSTRPDATSPRAVPAGAPGAVGLASRTCRAKMSPGHPVEHLAGERMDEVRRDATGGWSTQAARRSSGTRHRDGPAGVGRTRRRAARPVPARRVVCGYAWTVTVRLHRVWTGWAQPRRRAAARSPSAGPSLVIEEDRLLAATSEGVMSSTSDRRRAARHPRRCVRRSSWPGRQLLVAVDTGAAARGASCACRRRTHVPSCVPAGSCESATWCWPGRSCSPPHPTASARQHAPVAQRFPQPSTRSRWSSSTRLTQRTSSRRPRPPARS